MVYSTHRHTQKSLSNFLVYVLLVGRWFKNRPLRSAWFTVLVYMSICTYDLYYRKHEGNTGGTGDFTVGTSQQRLASEKTKELSTKSEARRMEGSCETESGD